MQYDRQKFIHDLVLPAIGTDYLIGAFARDLQIWNKADEIDDWLKRIDSCPFRVAGFTPILYSAPEYKPDKRAYAVYLWSHCTYMNDEEDFEKSVLPRVRNTVFEPSAYIDTSPPNRFVNSYMLYWFLDKGVDLTDPIACKKFEFTLNNIDKQFYSRMPLTTGRIFIKTDNFMRLEEFPDNVTYTNHGRINLDSCYNSLKELMKSDSYYNSLKERMLPLYKDEVPDLKQIFKTILEEHEQELENITIESLTEKPETELEEPNKEEQMVEADGSSALPKVEATDSPMSIDEWLYSFNFTNIN